MNLKIRIGYLEGSPTKATFEDLYADPMLRFSGQWLCEVSDLYVECRLFADGKPLSLPVRTSFRPSEGETCSWGQWLTIPVKYTELTPTTKVSLTVWNIYGPRRRIPAGGTTFPLFNCGGVMRSGRQKLYLWRDVEADPGSHETTPTPVEEGGPPIVTSFSTTTTTATPAFVKTSGEMARLEKCIRQYDRGNILPVTWLDPLTFREVDRVNAKETQDSQHLWLYISLPQFDLPVHCPLEEVPPPTFDFPGGLVAVHDPDMDRENPVEVKHKKLARSHRRDMLNRTLKPNAAERKEIVSVLMRPPTYSLTPEEKDLLWKFRFSLIREPKGLTKFLKCVDWSDGEELVDASQLVALWVPIDLDDALELLSAKKEFRHPVVREYAVRKLEETEDELLLLFLLQLVQALRYEERPAESSLGQLLARRAANNRILGNFLFWYLRVELEDAASGHKFQDVLELFMTVLGEREDGRERLSMLHRQGELVAHMTTLARELFNSSKDRLKQIQHLKDTINTSSLAELAEFPPLELPHHPEVVVKGIVGDKSTIFKSKQMPLSLHFDTVDRPGGYKVMFKQGDDLRQDQLIIQIITLMDLRLRKENLDLRLTPYRVLAASNLTGLVELVPDSVNMARILKDNRNDIQQWLRELNPDADGPYGIQPDVLDTFVRSCAGYCVITYILGIGDRHLDNLLVTERGALFHIDFGYILGRDPKPFPPPFKLCKEMVEAMGGAESPYYKQFVAHACESFNILRKSANLILNLFALMVDANLPELAVEPERSLARVHDNFRLDLTDEEAIVYFQQLISESVSALFPQMAETIHRWAQYWRR